MMASAKGKIEGFSVKIINLLCMCYPNYLKTVSLCLCFHLHEHRYISHCDILV